MPASVKDPDSWNIETAGFNATELSAYCRKRDLEKRHQQDQKENKQLKQDLCRKEKALAEAAALV